LPSDDPSHSTHQHPDLLKSAIYADEQTGPYSGHMAGMVSGLDKMIASHKHNRQNSPWHYWANPFVSGPINELLLRAQRRQLASSGKSMLNAALQEGSDLAGAAAGEGLGDAVDAGISNAGPAANLILGRAKVKHDARQAHKAVNEKHREGREEKDAEIGPYDISAAGMVRGLDDVVAGYERNRREKTASWRCLAQTP